MPSPAASRKSPAHQRLRGARPTRRAAGPAPSWAVPCPLVCCLPELTCTRPAPGAGCVYQGRCAARGWAASAWGSRACKPISAPSWRPYSGLILASMSSTQGRSSASRTECIRLGRSHAVLAASSMRPGAQAQRVLADDLVHPQRLCGHRIAAQRGDVCASAGARPAAPAAACPGRHAGLARLPLRQASGQPSTQRSNTAGGSQELREEHQLPVRRWPSRPRVPAHEHARRPACVHDLAGSPGFWPPLGSAASALRLASCITHRVMCANSLQTRASAGSATNHGGRNCRI